MKTDSFELPALSDEQVQAVYKEWLDVPGSANEFDLIQMAARSAIAAHIAQQGAEPVAHLYVTMETHDMGQSLAPNPPFKFADARALAAAKNLPLGEYRLYLAVPPAPQVAQAVPWENFPAYLIDHHEGGVITEEGLQFALAKMLQDPQYAAPVAQPATEASQPACQACGLDATRDVPNEATDFPGPYCDECGPGASPARERESLTDDAIWETAKKKCGLLFSDVLHMNKAQIVATVRAALASKQEAQGDGLASRPMHELTLREQEDAVRAFEASHIDSFQYGEVLHRVWIEGYDYARRAILAATPATPAQAEQVAQDRARWNFVEKAADEMKTSRYNTLVWLLGLSEGEEAEENMKDTSARFDLGKRIDAARTRDAGGSAV